MGIDSHRPIFFEILILRLDTFVVTLLSARLQMVVLTNTMFLLIICKINEKEEEEKIKVRGKTSDPVFSERDSLIRRA